MLRLMRSLAFATCATIAITGPVMTDAFGVGPPNAGWFADNATHTYCWGGGFNVALQNNAEYAMSVSLGNGTDITESFHAERRGPERRCPMAPVQSAPQGPHQWPLLGTSRAAE